MLVGALELSFADALTADAAKADALAAAPALALALAIDRPPPRPSPIFAAALVCARLGATHAVSRLEQPPGLVAAESADLAGVASWIGGIP